MLRVLHGKIIQDTFRCGGDILVTFRNPASKKGVARQQIKLTIEEYERSVRRIPRNGPEAKALLNA